MSVRSIITLSILREVHTKSVDFILAYTQAGVKSEIFMELPIVYGFEGAHPRVWVIILDKNIYGLNGSGLTWFDKTKEGIEARNFSNHKWTHIYGIRMKWFYYFMLMNA